MHIILGPPGTGKTTKLLTLVEDFMDRGVPPDRIGYFSFTRQAAQEAIGRAVRRFRLSPKDLPYFRTLHSFAMLRCGINKKNVMTWKHYEEAANWLKVAPFQELATPTEGPYQDHGLGDRFLEVINMSRICLLPLREVYNRSSVPLTTDWAKVEYVDRGLRAFKKAHDLYDFTDMLEMFVEQQLSPQFDVVFVDEVQDLSPLQWRMIDVISNHAKQIIVAGDDDQAIYRWAGADVDYFIRLAGTQEVLGQSFRIPASHHAISQRLIHQVHHRRQKEFRPRDEEGVVQWHRHSEEVNLDNGDWLLLSRTRKGAKQIEQEVRQRGLLYSFNLSNDVDSGALNAIRMWENLRKGELLSAADIRHVYRHMRLGQQVARGHKTLPGVDGDQLLNIDQLTTDHGLLTTAPWDEALGSISEEDSRYFRACIRRGERMDVRPRIRIATIHTAKGAEATNVMMLTDYPSKAVNSVRKGVHSEDDEARVFYVGLTRAKKELHLVHPMKGKGYPIP
jgi:DNA helicase-2/ATP-dependent DNA helicase PcrA